MKKILLFITIIVCTYSVSFAQGTIIIESKTGAEFSCPIDTITHMKVGPGTFYSQVKLKNTSPNTSLDVYVLEIDASNPNVVFRSVLGNDLLATTERPSNMAKRKSTQGQVYYAGVNGDFYATQGAVGTPTHAALVDGVLAKIPTNTQPNVGFAQDKIPFISHYSYNGMAKYNDNSSPINNINTTRGNNQLILYNQYHGVSTSSNQYGTEVLVELEGSKTWQINATQTVKVIQIEKDKGDMQIPAGAVVLSGNGTAQAFLDKLSVGDKLEIGLNIISPDFSTQRFTQMLGGDRIILKGGEVTNNDWAELHPRTGLGYTTDKQKIFFCVVDGRRASDGVTTRNLGRLMKFFGAEEAFNMDGGGSSCMYIKEFNQVNLPADGNERPVANAIFAVSTVEENDPNITEIRSKDFKILLPKYGVYKPLFMGYNQYGELVDPSLKDVILECDKSVGHITDDGYFVADGNGGEITASFNGVSTKVNVVLVPEAEIKIRLDSVLLDNKVEYPIEVESTIAYNTFKILPKALQWSTNKSEICKVEDGTLFGLSNGRAEVYGQLGTYKDTLVVHVQIAESDKAAALDFTDLNAWKPVLSGIKNFSIAGIDNGIDLAFQKSSGRIFSLRLSNDSPVYYGLPDSISMTINTGDVKVNTFRVSHLSNLDKESIVKEYADIPVNTDYRIGLGMKDLFPDNPSDIGLYPLKLEYLNFVFTGSSMVAETDYSISIKDFMLTYGNATVGIISPELLTRLSIFPNPANDMAFISLSLEKPMPVGVQLYSSNGTMLKDYDMGVCQTGELPLPLQGIPSGLYIVKLMYGEDVGYLKLIIK